MRGQSLDAATLAAAGRLAAEVTNPISDVRSSAEYRRTMTDVLTQRALRQAAAQGRGCLVAGHLQRKECRSEATNHARHQ